jgi:hypothetical protein
MAKTKEQATQEAAEVFAHWLSTPTEEGRQAA